MNDAIIEKVMEEELSAVRARILQKVKALESGADGNLEKFIMSQSADGEENEMKKIRRPVRIGNEVQWITASTEQEYAEKLIMLVTGANALAPQEEAKGTPFHEFLLDWYSVFKKRHDDQLNTTEISDERRMRLHILPYFEGMNVEDIRTADIQSMLNHQEGTMESNKKVLSMVKRALDYAIDQGLIQNNPAASSLLHVTGKFSNRTEPYTVEEMQYMVDHIGDLSNPYDKNWLLLMTGGCIRPEEALGFQCQDVNRTAGTFAVRRAVTHPDRNQPIVKEVKTEQSVRIIQLHAEDVAQMTFGKPTDWLVGGAHCLSYTQVRKMCRRIQREMKAEFPITPRRFRTTVATDIYEETKDLKLLQAAGGWASPDVPLRYYAKGRSSSSVASTAVRSLYHKEKGDGAKAGLD